MASVAEVLRHLVKHAPDLSDDHRQEYLDAVDAHPGLDADHAAEADEPKAEADEPKAEPNGTVMA